MRPNSPISSHSCGDIPGIQHNHAPSFGIGRGHNQDGLWWIKFGIDIEHPLAWGVVQELGHVLDYVS